MCVICACVLPLTIDSFFSFHQFKFFGFFYQMYEHTHFPHAHTTRFHSPLLTYPHHHADLLSWHQASAGQFQPLKRHGHSFVAYHSSIILYGGYSAGQTLGDMWFFDTGVCVVVCLPSALFVCISVGCVLRVACCCRDHCYTIPD